ncbi:MAG: prepilin-type N-terminal cleavage/methylation domain-containing protein [Planctomycetes bacterium]|nr:prepilin-type N-terminal cleavage/methylation domain-containing protein [Planctomycetota bacterium]
MPYGARALARPGVRPSAIVSVCAAPRRRGARAGFTLLEMLAVIVILGILMIVLLPRLLGTQKTAQEQLVRASLVQIGASIDEYEHKFGDYPPSAWVDAWGTAPNATNVGAECLVQSLWSNQWGGTTLSEDGLVNLDEDESKKPLSRLPTGKLFELKDAWDNPIAYLHRRDYGKQHAYVTKDGETGELVDNTVTAATNPTTKSPRNPNKYQLVSAGADGRFGTDDDLGNWAAEPKE